LGDNDVRNFGHGCLSRDGKAEERKGKKPEGKKPKDFQSHRGAPFTSEMDLDRKRQ